MDVIGSVMERPHVKEEISAKYHKILTMLEDEASTSKVMHQLFNFDPSTA